MSDAALWEYLIAIPAIIMGSYLIVWAIPGVIILSIVSLGSNKHIVFIDKQLAKCLSKYYDEKGYMKPRYQMPYSISSRFSNYCIAYPFIKNRAKTNSFKFKCFMWMNSLGYWSFWGTGIFIILAKMLRLIP